MRKVPTLFVRNPDDMSRVLPIPNSDAAWVFAGQGNATRKYDGTCVAYANFHTEQRVPNEYASHKGYESTGLKWWARREVKPNKDRPEGYIPVQLDPITGKTVGWEPIENSPFATFHAEALANAIRFSEPEWPSGTYELVGPKINGNPDGRSGHDLLRHDEAMPLPEVDDMLHQCRALGRDMEWIMSGLGDYLKILPYEGIVWHGQNGRMAKIKRRDFGHPWPIKGDA